MTDYKPANSKTFQEYFRNEADAKEVRVQLAQNHPDTSYIITKTNKDPQYPYEIYYRGNRKARQDSRLRSIVRKLKR